MTNKSLKALSLPVVGNIFILDLVGFSEEDVGTWNWYVEESRRRKPYWSLVSHQPLGIKVKREWRNRRLRATVELSTGQVISTTTYPAVQQDGVPAVLGQATLRAYADKLTEKFANLEKLLEELRLEKKAFIALTGADKKLERLLELQKQLNRQKLEISQLRVSNQQESERLQALAIKADKELADRKIELEKSRLELDSQKRAFESDSSLQAQLKKVAFWEGRAEEAWDVFEKANMLKVKLTPDARQEILEIVKSETSRFRKERMDYLDARPSKSSGCEIHGRSGSGSPSSWGNICHDCSK